MPIIVIVTAKCFVIMPELVIMAANSYNLIKVILGHISFVMLLKIINLINLNILIIFTKKV